MAKIVDKDKQEYKKYQRKKKRLKKGKIRK